MKQHVKNECLRQMEILERANYVANCLPESGPAPFQVSTVGTGEISYFSNNTERTEEIKAAFGADSWRVDIQPTAKKVERKTLECGLDVVVETLTPEMYQHQGDSSSLSLAR